jgi:hypothetical protein
MTDAMEAVRQGEMSINQAAIHFNVPYSSLYNRIKRIKAAEEAGESYEAALAESGPPPDDAPEIDYFRFILLFFINELLCDADTMTIWTKMIL